MSVEFRKGCEQHDEATARAWRERLARVNEQPVIERPYELQPSAIGMIAFLCAGIGFLLGCIVQAVLFA